MSQISITGKTDLTDTEVYLSSVLSQARHLFHEIIRKNEEMDTELWHLRLQMKKVKNHADQCDCCREALTK